MKENAYEWEERGWEVREEGGRKCRRKNGNTEISGVDPHGKW